MSKKSVERLKRESSDAIFQIIHSVLTGPDRDKALDAAKWFSKYLISEMPREVVADLRERLTVNLLYAKPEISEADVIEITDGVGVRGMPSEVPVPDEIINQSSVTPSEPQAADKELSKAGLEGKITIEVPKRREKKR